MRADRAYAKGGVQRTDAPYHRRFMASLRVRTLEVFHTHEPTDTCTPLKRRMGSGWSVKLL